MNTQITITSKRTETIYTFTVELEYRGQKIVGHLIKVDGEEDKIEADGCFLAHDKNMVLCEQIKQAIADYEKLHT